MKKIYLVRHCEAEGQAPNAPLTEKGIRQAEELATMLQGFKIERIFSSPYSRAIQSIEPFATKKQLEIEVDNRLRERVLSTEFSPDWLEKLEKTFDDLDLAYEGGESSNEAAKRILQVIDDIKNSNVGRTVIVAHGGILSVLLNHYDQAFSFEQWRRMTNPDVFLLTISEPEVGWRRLWKDE